MKKPYSIVVVAEGIRTDGHKTAAQYIGEVISQNTGTETRETILGYIQRGGTPVAYDRSLATALGVKAVNLIQEKRYALQEQKRLKEIEEQIKNIGYDEVRHRKLNRKIEELSNAPLEKVKLEEAEKKIDSLRDGLSELQENYQQKELNLKDLEKKKEKIRGELKELSSLREKLVQEEQVLNSEQILKDKGITLAESKF